MPVFSRDETVTILTSYYEFLTGIHIPATAIKYPPTGGWPQLTSECLSFLNKNDDVVDLIRHLPFIQRDDYYEPYQIYQKAATVNFTGKLIQEEASSNTPDLSICEPLDEISTAPSHVLTLATTARDRNGHFIFLDTTRGTVTICDFEALGVATDLSLPIDHSGEQWRSQPTYMVSEFLDLMKGKFRSFEVIAINEREVAFGRRFETPVRSLLKKTYENCGWLTKDYRREECIELIKQISQH